MPTEESGWKIPADTLQDFNKMKSDFGSQVQPEPEQDFTDVQKIKQLRKDADALVQRVKDLPSSRETSLTITNFQQGIMWLGMELKRINDERPYPSSYDPNTGDKIEPTADGLKL